MSPADDLLRESLGDFVARVAAPTPAPAAGSCAAVVAALAAALGAMAARASRIEGAERRCRALMDRVSPLAQADSEAYAEVLRAPASERRMALGRASEVPLAVAEAARTTSELGAELCAAGDSKLRGEAVAAAILGEAAARVAAVLVGMNLASEPGDGRIRRAREHAAAAQHAARRAAEGR